MRSSGVKARPASLRDMLVGILVEAVHDFCWGREGRDEVGGFSSPHRL